MRYHTQKQRKIKFEPRIKLNHNKNIKVIYHAFKWINDVRRSLLLTITQVSSDARTLFEALVLAYDGFNASFRLLIFNILNYKYYNHA